MERLYRLAVLALRAPVVAVLVALRRPRQDLAGPDPNRQDPEVVRCPEDGPVVPDDRGKCPVCGAELIKK